MFKFLYSLCAWILTHYEDMPADFQEKFSKEKVRDLTLIISNVDVNSKLFE